MPPRFEVYRAISREVRDVFAEYTPLVEPLSLDEAYLDVTENLKGIPTAVRVATEIRAEILERTGLTASAGVSYNKFLAKLASGQRKPNGQFVITPEMGPAFVEGLEVSKFHGVGPATAAKMARLGIRTGKDLRERPLAFLRQHFGKAAAHFHAIARGEDDRPVRPDRPRKSAGSETTYPRDLGDPREVEAGVEALADEVWAWCERTGDLRPDGDREAALRRLPHADPQPHRRGAGRQPGRAGGRRRRARAGRVPSGEEGQAARGRRVRLRGGRARQWLPDRLRLRATCLTARPCAPAPNGCPPALLGEAVCDALGAR